MVELVKDPENFDEAYNHPEANKKIMWRRAISKEFEEVKAKGVWEKFQKSEIPNGRNCIKNKWVLKPNVTEYFLVACGYSQIPEYKSKWLTKNNDLIILTHSRLK
jgi:hypothetical protein